MPPLRLRVNIKSAGKKKPSEVINRVLQVTETPLGAWGSATTVALTWKDMDEPVLLVDTPVNFMMA